MNWYLLQTKPNAHSTAFEQLKRQGFEVFLPLIIKTAKRNGKFLEFKAPLFPGYLFIGTSTDPIPWNKINSTRGVSKAVTLDGVYRPVSSHIIKGIKRRCNVDNVIQRLDNIVPGNRIKIESGPFTEFICTVDQIKDDQRAWVLIDILQQKTKAEVPLDSVSKIN